MTRNHRDPRQDVDLHGIPNYEMPGGQSRDFHEENARNRELRETADSSSGASQPYSQQQADAKRQGEEHGEDAEYSRWREERYAQFSAEFSRWRQQRMERGDAERQDGSEEQ